MKPYFCVPAVALAKAGVLISRSEIGLVRRSQSDDWRTYQKLRRRLKQPKPELLFQTNFKQILNRFF